MRRLIDEGGQDLSLFGYTVNRNFDYGIEVCELKVDTYEKSQRLDFQIGDYFIVNSPLVHMLDNACVEYTALKIADVLKQLITKKYNKILFVGIGNPKILADALGSFTLDMVDLQDGVFKICPNIYSNTGMQTFDFVHYISKGLGVDLVVIIDSLVTESLERIGTSFQINTAGISPGSGVKNKNKAINEESLGVDCIVIGVPFMLMADSLIKTELDMILSPKDIHEQVDTSASVLSKAINNVLSLVRK